MEYNKTTDFIKRTKKIIEQYESFKNKLWDNFFDVTLLLNCFIWLVIFPKEKEIRDISTIWDINKEDRWIDPKKIETDEKKSIKNVVRHLRNSLSHCRFEVRGKGTVSSILFQDCDARSKKLNFKLELSIEEIKTFVEKFSEYMIEQKN
jgi:hypothetical protein